MSYIVAFLVLGILVFIHEFGHFIAAKGIGVPVKTFAIGFGKALFKKTHNGTEYRLNVFPLGGYISLVGEDNADDPDSFTSQPYWKRFIVFMAGVTFNLIGAVVILFFIYIISGAPTRGFVIQEVMPQAMAAEYLKPNDLLVSINGQDLKDSEGVEVPKLLGLAKDDVIELQVNRNGSILDLQIPLTDIDGEKMLGVYFQYQLSFIKQPNISVSDFITQPLKETGYNMKLMLSSLKMMVSGQVSTDDISGPVGIIQTTSTIAQNDVTLLFYWMALLSLNLAIMNALPFPALDGGQVLFLLCEFVYAKVLHKKWSHSKANMANMAFLFLIFGFMIYICVLDFIKLF